MRIERGVAGMRARRGVRVALGLLVALGLGAGGCGEDAGDGTGWELGADAGDVTPADSGETGDADAEPDPEDVSDVDAQPDAGDGCPVAIATATLESSGVSAPATQLTAPLFSTIQLDATRSYASRGGIARYEWTLLSAPSGNLERVQPEASSRPTLALNMLGEYRVALRVFDAQGRSDCAEPVIVEIQATTDADILVQLTWDVPSISADAQGGTDVDLHYRNLEAGAWNTAPWDCFYSNKRPDWGVIGDSADDPTYWQDVTEGRGPESVTHSNLEHIAYAVGAFYYDDWQLGASVATVRVFTHGVEAFAMKDQRMTPKQFWEVAHIDGRTLSVRPVGTVTQGFP